jgi:hypothetical protein
MLLTLGTQGQSAKAVYNQAANMPTGFQVPVDVSGRRYSSIYANAIRNPTKSVTESDVSRMTSLAASSEIANKLYAEYAAQRLKVVQNVTAMHQTDLRTSAQLGGLSANLAKAQNQAVEQMAGHGYAINMSNSHRVGVVEGYRQGYNLATKGF